MSRKPLSHLVTNSSDGGLAEVLMPQGEKGMFSTYDPGGPRFTLIALKKDTVPWLKRTVLSPKMRSYS